MTDREPGPALAAAARGMLLGVAFAGAALLFYALNRFRSLTGTRALSWYALAALVMAFGYAASRMRPARRVGLVLLCVTTALMLWGLEWAAETAQRARFERQQRAVEELTGIPFDERTIADVVRDLRTAGTPAVPSIVPKVMIDFTLPGSDPRSHFAGTLFPLGGISRRPTVQLCNEDGRYPVYLSDRHGFLNPGAAWDSLPASLVLIGDSFTHGYCVPLDSTLASLLRRRWPGLLNLGMGGSGPLSELGTLTEYGLAAHPRLVLWLYFENDLEDLANERRHPVLARYLEPGFSQQLLERQGEADSQLVPWVDRLYARGLAPRGGGEHGLRQLLTLDELRTLLRSVRRREAADYQDQVPLFRQVLAGARDRVTAGGGRMVMVFLPRWERYYGPASASDDRSRTGVLAAARELGVPVIDLTPVFGGSADRARLFGRRQIGKAHYSSSGYALVAGTIEIWLDSSKSLTAHRPQ